MATRPATPAIIGITGYRSPEETRRHREVTPLKVTGEFCVSRRTAFLDFLTAKYLDGPITQSPCASRQISHHCVGSWRNWSNAICFSFLRTKQWLLGCQRSVVP